MNVTLAKSLKVKNQLAGEVKELESLISSINSYKEGTPQKFVAENLMSELEDKIHRLVITKTAIQAANASALPMLVEIAEMKAFASWLKSLSTTEGPQLESGGYGSPAKEVIWKATFDAKWVRDMVKGTEVKISDLQDQIDSYNATTTVIFV
jgi:hypothetical protein